MGRQEAPCGQCLWPDSSGPASFPPGKKRILCNTSDQPSAVSCYQAGVSLTSSKASRNSCREQWDPETWCNGNRGGRQEEEYHRALWQQLVGGSGRCSQLAGTKDARKHDSGVWAEWRLQSGSPAFQQQPQDHINTHLGEFYIGSYLKVKDSTKSSGTFLVLVRGFFLYHLKAYVYSFILSRDSKFLGAPFMA